MRHTFYAYYVDDVVTDSKLAFRLASGLSQLSSQTANSGIIGFKVRGDVPQAFSFSGAFTRMKDSLYATQDGETVSSYAWK